MRLLYLGLILFGGLAGVAASALGIASLVGMVEGGPSGKDALLMPLFLVLALLLFRAVRAAWRRLKSVTHRQDGQEA